MRTPLRMLRLTLAVVAVAGLGCEEELADERPQWVVHVATDAQLPQFGDRLRLEILRPDGSELLCGGCRQDFAVGLQGALPLSFGVAAPADGDPPLIRAELYRASYLGFDGKPHAGSGIVSLGRLPAADGVREVGMALRMDCFGVADDPVQGLTCDPASGQLNPAPTLGEEDVGQLPATGSWPPGHRVPCGGEIPEGMVCIEGGTFLLGTRNFFPLNDLLLPLPERLVQLAPFALDIEEFTVGDVKLLEQDGLLEFDEIPGEPRCTYREGPEQDELPLNCITHFGAALLCDKRGKRVPTEAEWEFAAGNGVAETPFPWGHDTAVADFAVLSAAGPVAGGHPLDYTAAGVHDLGGNLVEWVADHFWTYAQPCWPPDAHLLLNPVCDTENIDPELREWHPLKGGGYSQGEPNAAGRNARMDSLATYSVGFRCAKSMAPPP